VPCAEGGSVPGAKPSPVAIGTIAPPTLPGQKGGHVSDAPNASSEAALVSESVHVAAVARL